MAAGVNKCTRGPLATRVCLAHDSQVPLPTTRRCLYHALHKLYDAQRLVAGEALHVASRGEERDRILATRRLGGPPFAAQLDLLDEVEAAVGRLVASLAGRGPPLPPEADVSQLSSWLLSVRRRQLAALEPPPARPVRSASSSGGSGAEPAGEEDSAEVASCLRQLEEEHGVALLFCAEVSSRVIGSSHSRSDHDLVAVFVPPPAAYLSIEAPRKKLSASFATAGCTAVDVVAYELRHASSMLASNNPTLFEALRSPIVYAATEPFASGARALAERYDALALAASWLHHAKRNHVDFIAGASRRGEEGPVRKKYLHVLRPLLSVRWLRERGRLELPAEGGECPEDDATEVDPAAERWPPQQLQQLLSSLGAAEGDAVYAEMRAALGAPAALAAVIRSLDKSR